MSRPDLQYGDPVRVLETGLLAPWEGTVSAVKPTPTEDNWIVEVRREGSFLTWAVPAHMVELLDPEEGRHYGPPYHDGEPPNIPAYGTGE